MLSEELKFFWDSVKYHLCDNGLCELERLYPELRTEIQHIREYRPVAILNATRFQDKMVGSVVKYVGERYQSYTKGETVTIMETPMCAAIKNVVCFMTSDGFIFSAPRIDLRFE